MFNPFIRIIYQIPEPSQYVRNRSFSATDRTGYRRKYHIFASENLIHILKPNCA